MTSEYVRKDSKKYWDYSKEVSMKAISIREPWASMIASGKKTIETRKWKTNYRGPLVIIGSKKPNGTYAGRTACIVDLVDIYPMTSNDEAKACCAVYTGAYAWTLTNLRECKHLEQKGQLSIYDIPYSEEFLLEGYNCRT